VSSIQLTALAWLLTYALHSTLLLAAVWLVARWLRSARVRELLWRTALFGALASATVQVLLLPRWSSARWVLEPAPVAQELDAVASEPAEWLAAPPPSEEEAALLATAPAQPWIDWSQLGWALGGVALLASIVAGARGLAFHFTRRRPVREDPMLTILADLCARTGVRRGVRLTVSPRLRTPVALGLFRPEICVPPRALHQLSRRSAEAMLAHELAHLARFDPLWHALARLVRTVFFFQPLNRLACRRLNACAEFLCDEWAVARTGDRLGLARCLSEVADWLVGARRAAPVCPMADLHSPLGARIERILDEERRSEPRGAGLLPIGVALLAATVVLAPGFAAPRAEEPEAPPPTASTEDRIGALWAGVERQWAALEEEFDRIQAIAEERELAPATRERLLRTQERLRNFETRKDVVGALLARWQARLEDRTATPTRTP